MNVLPNRAKYIFNMLLWIWISIWVYFTTIFFFFKFRVQSKMELCFQRNKNNFEGLMKSSQVPHYIPQVDFLRKFWWATGEVGGGGCGVCGVSASPHSILILPQGQVDAAQLASYCLWSLYHNYSRTNKEYSGVQAFSDVYSFSIRKSKKKIGKFDLNLREGGKLVFLIKFAELVSNQYTAEEIWNKRELILALVLLACFSFFERVSSKGNFSFRWYTVSRAIMNLLAIRNVQLIHLMGAKLYLVV